MLYFFTRRANCQSIFYWLSNPESWSKLVNAEFDNNQYNQEVAGNRTMYDFHNSTDTFKFWTEKWAIHKTFFVFHPILMKLGEIIVLTDN